MWPKQCDVPEFFGERGENQTRLKLPYPMRLAWPVIEKGVTIHSKVINEFSIHEKVHDSALRAFQNVLDFYGEDRIKELHLDMYGGCLNVRRTTGNANVWSMHSWGIAIDFDPLRNQYPWSHRSACLAHKDYDAFWDAWEAEGWVSLGRSRDYDWMHVQAARF